jgi:hypothetical protein
MLPAHREVALVEEEIEGLAERIENGRKFAVAARALIVVGSCLLALLPTGIAYGRPALLVFGVAALLAGFVLLGSNRTSVANLRTRLAACESKREELIAALDLRTVPSPAEANSA